jgi:hypothetical protein
MCQPELLDHLPPDDVRAMRSRRDLRRVNSWMGNARFMAGALNAFLPRQPHSKILEIGAGDGTFFLKAAKCLPQKGAVFLLDRQNLITPAMHAEFRQLGWELLGVTGDVFEHLVATSRNGRTGPTYDAIIANLFLHHFSDDHVSKLFKLAEQMTPLFIAVEPRRSPVALFAGRLLWAIGCNAVTRHDAMVSIRAGFCDRELSSLWPKMDGWVLEERPAGFSSHLFIARASDAK